MSRFKLINIFDSIFIIFTTFLIVFAFIQFFLGGFWLSLTLSLIVTFSIIFIYKCLKNKIDSKKEINKKTKQETEDYYFNFAMMTKSKQLNLIKNFIPEEKNPIIKSNQIVCKNQIITISNSANEIDKYGLIDTIKECLNSKKEIIVFAYGYSQDAKNLAKSLEAKITLLDKNNFYIMCKNNKIIFNNKIKNIEKIKLKDVFINFFSKNHSKGFFFSGFVLILTSFIIPFKNYYLFFGIILLIFSLICKLKKQEKIEDFKF